MLPLLHLTSTDIVAPDALQRASSLVPEDSDGLRGGFASLLRNSAQPGILLPVAGGDAMPATGKPLPVTLTVNEFPQDTDVGLRIAEVDLASLVSGQPDTGSSVGAGRPELDVEITSDAGSETVPDSALPAITHVPPGPPVSDPVEPVESTPAGDTAGNAIAGMAQMPLVPPLSNVADRGNRLQERDRAIDSTSMRQQTVGAAVTRAGGTMQATTVNDRAFPVGERAAPGIAAAMPQDLRRRGLGIEGSAAHRAPTELPVSRDDVLRAVRDDGLPVSRPVQPAPWQPATAVPEVVVDSNPRIHAEFSAAMPRTATGASTPPLSAVVQTIDIPVQQTGWDGALAERVTMMANGRLQNAELRLTPAELGPLRIQLEIDDGVANVSFQSQHPLTREALEQAMPRLRELLAENGLSLGQADVGDDSNQPKSRDALADGRSSPGTDADASNLDEPVMTGVARRAADGLVDTFA